MIDKNEKIFELTWVNKWGRHTASYSIQDLVDEVLVNLNENLIDVVSYKYIEEDN